MQNKISTILELIHMHHKTYFLDEKNVNFLKQRTDGVSELLESRYYFNF